MARRKTRAARKHKKARAPITAAQLMAELLERAAALDLAVRVADPDRGALVVSPMSVVVSLSAARSLLKRHQLPRGVARRLRAALAAVQRPGFQLELEAALRLRADEPWEWLEDTTAASVAAALRAQGHNAHAVGDSGISISAQVQLAKPASFTTMQLTGFAPGSGNAKVTATGKADKDFIKWASSAFAAGPQRRE